MKLSGAERISKSGSPYRDAIAVARALIDAAPSGWCGVRIGRTRT